MNVEEKMKLIESALVKLRREDAAEGINFTLEEREVVIGALDVGSEIVRRVLGRPT
jgi:hypothetical protein